MGPSLGLYRVIWVNGLVTLHRHSKWTKSAFRESRKNLWVTPEAPGNAEGGAVTCIVVNRWRDEWGEDDRFRWSIWQSSSNWDFSEASNLASLGCALLRMTKGLSLTDRPCIMPNCKKKKKHNATAVCPQNERFLKIYDDWLSLMKLWISRNSVALQWQAFCKHRHFLLGYLCNVFFSSSSLQALFSS